LAAAAGDHVLVVAGSEEVAETAAAWGADVLLEPREEGQNAAAKRGIERAVEAGAGAVLLLSSDLPLVTEDSVREVLDAVTRLRPPVVVAVPATGRGGTNALYVRPPDAIGLHFGDESLAKFRDDADARGVEFVIHQSDAMASASCAPKEPSSPRPDTATSARTRASTTPTSAATTASPCCPTTRTRAPSGCACVCANWPASTSVSSSLTHLGGRGGLA
jgi:hypothetical protein